MHCVPSLGSDAKLCNAAGMCCATHWSKWKGSNMCSSSPVSVRGWMPASMARATMADTRSLYCFLRIASSTSAPAAPCATAPVACPPAVSSILLRVAAGGVASASTSACSSSQVSAQLDRAHTP